MHSRGRCKVVQRESQGIELFTAQRALRQSAHVSLNLSDRVQIFSDHSSKAGGIRRFNPHWAKSFPRRKFVAGIAPKPIPIRPDRPAAANVARVPRGSRSSDPAAVLRWRSQNRCEHPGAGLWQPSQTTRRDLPLRGKAGAPLPPRRPIAFRGLSRAPDASPESFRGGMRFAHLRLSLPSASVTCDMESMPGVEMLSVGLEVSSHNSPFTDHGSLTILSDSATQLLNNSTSSGWQSKK